jgi:hypothetical protein
MIEKGGGAGGTGNTCDVCESGGENTARAQLRPPLGERHQLHLVSEVLLDVPCLQAALGHHLESCQLSPRLPLIRFLALSLPFIG